MLGGGNTVTKDVPPYVLASRNPVVFEGLNLVGLRRKGFSNETIEEIRDIYRIIYSGGMTVADACINIRSAFPQTPHRDTILSFVENSGRGIIKCPVK